MAFGGFGDTAGGRDRSFERAAALNQLLLGLVVLVITVMLVASPAASGMPLFFAGIVLVFIATGAAVIVPWNRINAWWLTAVPVADILAITLMRLADPRSGIGLLWVFPAIWLSSMGVLLCWPPAGDIDCACCACSSAFLISLSSDSITPFSTFCTFSPDRPWARRRRMSSIRRAI